MNQGFTNLSGRLVIPFYCRLYQVAGPTLLTSTFSLFDWDAEHSDKHNMHDNIINPSRITITITGIYSCLARIRFVNNTTGIRETEIYLNGTATTAKIVGINTQPANSGTALTTVTAVCKMLLVPGDYLEVMGFQNSGGNLATEGGIEGYRNGFSVQRVG